QVCQICKGRKKKCDKQLPQCGYCVHVHLDARSTSLPETTESDTTTRSSPATDHAGIGLIASNGCKVLRPASIDTSPVASPLATLAPNTAFSLALAQLVQPSELSINDLISRYFNGVHLWIPFFCPGRLRKDMIRYSSFPTAEFSLLVLCMSLLTNNPAHHNQASMERSTIYLCAKTYLAQFQVMFPVCIQWVQAGIFVSMYEYACGKPDTALATIDNCARQAYKLGIHQKPTTPGWSEGWNTWWATRMFERVYNCETSTSEIPLITSAPDKGDLLPHEVDEGDWEPRLYWAAPLAPLSSPDAGCLGRAAQAAYLLDRVVRTTSMTPAQDGIADLAIIDKELQFLLSAVMDKCHGKRGGHCGAVGISISRALFILHQHILTLDASAIETQMRQHSEVALDTVAQMVVDIARSHRDIPISEIDIVSPICHYIVRDTLEHLYKNRYADQDAWFE
ncbi:hypothetical protein EK21DRAFT_15160, partial [Setomelanomma holmii]